jgi:23S rRNA pseudouridine2605 synthase
MKPKRTRNGGVSLARAISKLGFASRSQAAKMIGEGRVEVNGEVVTDPSARVTMEDDRVAVDGRTLEEKEFLYILFHKPTGCVTTRSDERGNKTIYDYLGGIDAWVFPVGRLDKETSGLLLLTNDHRLGELLTNPGSKVGKTYRVTLDRPIETAHLRLFEEGMELKGERLLPALISERRGNIFDMTIVEGRNRQIRRMCEALGYSVEALQRIRIGALPLGSLEPGTWKKANRSEIQLMQGTYNAGHSEQGD